jgi:hypothetical protein
MSRSSSASKAQSSSKKELSNDERRQHRRHDLEPRDFPIDRWDGGRRTTKSFGKIVDLSAGGVRVRTSQGDVQADQQIRVRMELPAYAGISPFLTSDANQLEPRNEWIGWMTVSRVKPVASNEYEIAGRLVDMDEMDRGMLGLYLSTQPLAA